MNEIRPPGRASLAGRLLAAYALVFILLIGLFGFLTLRAVESVLREQAAIGLAQQARAAQIALGDVPRAALQEAVEAHAAALEARLTVIALDGTVVADSASNPAQAENHRDRPEVVAARSGTVGEDSRRSATTGVRQTYVAVPPAGDVIFRLSITEEQLARQVADVAALIGVAALLAGVAGVGLMAFVARRVARPIQELTGIAGEVSEGRLATRARRSSIRELDTLGLSIGRIAQELGNRVVAAESEREMLEALLDSLPQGVILVAPDESILYGNGTARGIVGEVPHRISALAPPVLQRLVRAAKDTDETQATVLESAGAVPATRALASPLPDGRVLLVITDISERIRIEAMRRDFVADASHELKTPIASILAASETLLMALERDPERADRFAALVHDSALQLARIVGDLLDLSRVETSAGGDARVRFDQVVAEEVDRLATTAADKGIGLSTELRPTYVTGSAADLGLAVRNLVSNAIRYSAAGDHVRVGLQVEHGQARLFVEDTGVGIPTRSVSRVFERFYRVDVARSRETGGTGLGLAIVKHVAEAHGGAVSVESELGVGSTFHLTLPIAPEVD